MDSIRIIIADDHPLVRAGLREAIDRETGMSVVAEADSGAEAMRLVASCRSDVLVLDIEMPDLSGVDVLRALRDRPGAPRVVMLTVHRSAEVYRAVMELGAHGYVLKESAIEDVVLAIQAAHEGGYFVSPSLDERTDRDVATSADLLIPGLRSLTPAERTVLRLIAGGADTQTVADRLHVSPRTVTHHRENISAKLDLRGNNALLRFALLQRTLILETLGEGP